MSNSPPPCPRCFSQAEVIRPWAGFLWIKRGWVAGLGLTLAAMPFVFMDIFVSIPLLAVYALAAGPVFRFAAEQPYCPDCRLPRPTPGRNERPIRPVRAVPDGRVEAGASGPPQAGEDEGSGLRPLPSPPAD